MRDGARGTGLRETGPRTGGNREAGNDRSERAVGKFIDRAGGQYDGLLRNWTPLDGEVADHHRYTVSREEFQQAQGEP